MRARKRKKKNEETENCRRARKRRTKNEMKKGKE